MQLEKPVGRTLLQALCRTIKTVDDIVDIDRVIQLIQDAIAASQPDIIYHLAAFYTPAHDMNSVDRLVESNLLLGAEVLEAMTASGCRRLVYATTASTHSTGDQYSPLTLYAATKQAFSDLVTYYTDRGFLRAAAVSIADSYGPGDLRPKVLELIRRSALPAGWPLSHPECRRLHGQGTDAVPLTGFPADMFGSTVRAPDRKPCAQRASSVPCASRCNP